jgi:hypothetical protein
MGRLFLDPVDDLDDRACETAGMNKGRADILLAKVFPELRRAAAPVPGRREPFILFLSVSDGNSRARVVTVQGETLAEAWQRGTGQVRALVKRHQLNLRWLRVDHVDSVEETDWARLRQRLTATKRNYFRRGIALDAECRKAFLETELNANAMLYGGAGIGVCVLNEKNFLRYAKLKHAVSELSFADQEPVWLFSSRGLFVGDDLQVVKLQGPGPDAGRRIIEKMQPADVDRLIETSSRYLAGQIKENGRFHYGWHPCFDREIEAYNALRHASSLYALAEAWEVTQERDVRTALERGLSYLVQILIKRVALPSGERAAFLVDVGDEIKLGGNAVCLLALTKYTEITGDRQYLPLLEELAVGILFMQNPETGAFVHVLNHPSLEVKQPFRIIYYDGEAAFGLMRLYGLTKDARWLAAVERAFSYFIEKQHWKAHDHWLSYCVNELTLYRPKREYFEFGIQNFIDHLDFVAQRITTFPTLLELMMAAEQMIVRIQGDPEHASVLDRVDLEKFHFALEKRAHYMLNGYFWPELAIFYARPSRIVGSFFIRHHAFRVRIDDVEHYLSGYVAYRRYLLRWKAKAVATSERPVAAVP